MIDKMGIEVRMMMRWTRWFLVWGLCCGSGAPCVADGGWRTLRDCKLIPHAANDGDSFHVAHAGRHYIFRICFVDAPETSRLVPERVTKQAAWWGVSEAAVLHYAKEARRFSLAFLKDGFTVYTQYEDAGGWSERPRHFALIEVDGGFLCEALVEAGLGRAYGFLPDLPDGTSRWVYRAKLQKLEAKAKAEGRGLYGRVRSGVADDTDLIGGKTVTLKRPLSLSVDTDTGAYLGKLESGAEVFVPLQSDDGLKVTVKATLDGQTVSGKCWRRDLDLEP